MPPAVGPSGAPPAEGPRRPLGRAGRWWATEHAGRPLLVLVEPDVELRERELRGVALLAGALPMPVAVPAPVVAAETVAADTRWFEAPAGFPAAAPQNHVDVLATLTGLGRALRRLHAVPVPDGLARLGAAQLVGRAAAAVRAGRVERANLDPSRAGMDPIRIVEQLEALLPLLERRAARRPVAPVLTHGAARLDTIWLDRGEPSAVLDVAGLALADPYRDLAVMTRDLAAALGPEALAPFFDAYGEPAPDVIRLEFHALLDELR